MENLINKDYQEGATSLNESKNELKKVDLEALLGLILEASDYTENPFKCSACKFSLQANQLNNPNYSKFVCAGLTRLGNIDIKPHGRCKFFEPKTA